MLVNYHRNDPRHQVVHSFNETTPRCAVGDYAYKDFLWRDSTVTRGELGKFPLSHLSPGAGYVYARSSWEEDATYLFFKCGDRFTAHQHLDVGHFVIYKHEELAGDGGHYDEFGTVHDVNYHLRTIAHSTLLVQDPEEKWPAIRAGKVTGNDGGQTHSWAHHNGAMGDVADWQRQKDKCDIANIVAFEDQGKYLYVVGEATCAYASHKLELFTRQIVFLRPNTFVILDHVKARKPEYHKTWLLQAMKPPTRSGQQLMITNGQGRLFVQSLLPLKSEIRLQSGDDLYRYGGRVYPPKRKTGAAPECRIEISPREQNRDDHFLNILTAADASTESVPQATVTRQGSEIIVALGQTRIEFIADRVGGQIIMEGLKQPLGK
jgi:heparin/heparan-sulfate lyase